MRWSSTPSADTLVNAPSGRVTFASSTPSPSQRDRPSRGAWPHRTRVADSHFSFDFERRRVAHFQQCLPNRHRRSAERPFQHHGVSWARTATTPAPDAPFLTFLTKVARYPGAGQRCLIRPGLTAVWSWCRWYAPASLRRWRQRQIRERRNSFGAMSSTLRQRSRWSMWPTPVVLFARAQRRPLRLLRSAPVPVSWVEQSAAGRLDFPATTCPHRVTRLQFDLMHWKPATGAAST